jgi:hypothetical protein
MRNVFSKYLLKQILLNKFTEKLTKLAKKCFFEFFHCFYGQWICFRMVCKRIRGFCYIPFEKDPWELIKQRKKLKRIFIENQFFKLIIYDTLKKHFSRIGMCPRLSSIEPWEPRVAMTFHSKVISFYSTGLL